MGESLRQGAVVEIEVIANRAEKILGAISKVFAYPFHWIFPKKRFAIPLLSLPKRHTADEYRIPKIIWQTNYTNEVSLPVYLNYLFNRLLSLDWEYRYVSTEEREVFIKANADERTYKAYAKLTDGASQADFWRVFVINKLGGLYLDIDAHFVWNLSSMIKPDDTEMILLKKNGLNNTLIASTPNNPHLQKSLDLMVENIEQKRVDKGVYFLTGPAVLKEVIKEDECNSRFYRTTCIQGTFTNEYFQYIDKPRGKWTYAKNETLLRED